MKTVEFKSIIGYYDNGNIKEISSYKNGKLEGERKFFYEKNGQLFVQCFYKDGKKDGEYRFYDFSGKLAIHVIYENGHVKEILFPKINDISTDTEDTRIKGLYLDDIRIPLEPSPIKWEIVRSYEEFVRSIKTNGLNHYEIVSLDHDLGDNGTAEEKNGYHAAKFLVEESIETEVMIPEVYVHCANPVGRDNIIRYINNYYKHCGKEETCKEIHVPYVPMY